MKRGLLFALLTFAVPVVHAQNLSNGLTPAQAKRAEAYYHFSMARVYHQQERWTEALEEYKKAAELSPNDSVIFSSMAQTYLNIESRQDAARNREEAVKAAETAVKLNRDNVGAHRILKDLFIATLNESRTRTPLSAQEEARMRQIVEAGVDGAIKELEEIIRIDPSDRTEFLQLATLYRIDGSPEKAADVLKKHIDLEPESEAGILELAKLYIDSSNVASAIEVLQQFIKNQPDAEEALELLGDAYSDLGDTRGAADAYGRLLKVSGDPEHRDKYADALYRDDQFAAAAKEYEGILQDDQRNDLIMIRLGQIYRRLERYDEARSMLNRAMAVNPDDINPRFNLVLVDRDEGKFAAGVQGLNGILKDTEKGAGRYTREERQNRNVLLTNLGLLHSLLMDYDGAVAAFMRIRDLSDSGERERVDTMIVDTYRSAKNLDGAMAHLQMAMKENPNSRALQMSYADLISARGKPDEGIQTLQKLAEGGEPDFELLSAMAGIYESANRFTEAQAVLDTAMKRFPDEKTVYFLQGALHERQKKYSEAEQAFRRALEIDDDDPSVLNYLGYMLADRGLKLEEALTMIKKAVDSDPINGAFLDSLGWVYFKLGQYDMAERYLKRAVVFAANNATMHDHLGDLYFRTGRIPEAQASWTTGLQFADDPEEAESIRQKLNQAKARAAN